MFLSQSNNTVAVSNANADLVEAYNNGRKYYVTDSLDRAIEQFQKVTEKDPTFNGDVTAFLFLTYRARAEQELNSTLLRAKAPQTFNEALVIAEKYRTVLLEQLKPNILLNKFPSGAALLEDTTKQKRWIERYFKGRSFNSNKDGPEWWRGAIEAWEPLYKENKDYLPEPKEESLAVLLAEAYSQKAIYTCSVMHNFAEANTALEQQIEISQTANFGDKGQKLKEAVERLADYKQSQCRSS
jgi:lipopolysaccharide biosynthesis regulator YciM